MVGRIFFYLGYPVLTNSYQILYKSLKLGHCGQVDVFGIKSTLWCFQEYLVLILPSKMKGLIASESLGESKYANCLIGNGTSVWCKH